MKSHPLTALGFLLLFSSIASADAGLPRPRYVGDASDTQVYAQNLIVLGLLLAGIPTAVGLLVARRTPRWGYRLGAVFLAGVAGFVLVIVGYLAGLFITNDLPPYLKYRRNLPPPTQPTEQTTDPSPQ
jgi:hypothetical protein